MERSWIRRGSGVEDRSGAAEKSVLDLKIIGGTIVDGTGHPRTAGGRRILQDAKGYVATIVSGVVTRRNDRDTGARPGRLVRVDHAAGIR